MCFVQFRRDVDDEKLWIAEKMPLATNTEYGNSLFNVHMLKKKNQVCERSVCRRGDGKRGDIYYNFLFCFFQSLSTETDNHEPRIHTVCNNGQKLIDEGHEDAELFTDLIHDLKQRWSQLKDAVNHRYKMLLQSENAKQVLFECFFLRRKFCSTVFFEN